MEHLITNSFFQAWMIIGVLVLLNQFSKRIEHMIATPPTIGHGMILTILIVFWPVIFYLPIYPPNRNILGYQDRMT